MFPLRVKKVQFCIGYLISYFRQRISEDKKDGNY